MNEVQSEFDTKEEAKDYFSSHIFTLPSNAPTVKIPGGGFELVQVAFGILGIRNMIYIRSLLFRHYGRVGHDGNGAYRSYELITINNESLKEGALKEELWWSNPSTTYIQEKITKKKQKDECPNCGERGIFIRTALICPKDKTLIGGF